MDNNSVLKKYSELVLRKGVNLQVGQGLEISCPVERADLARAMTEVAYSLGAKIVRIRYNDEAIDKLSYENAETSVLERVPKWLINMREELIKENFCYVALSSEDPTLFNNVNAEKLKRVAVARSKALKRYSDAIMNNEIRWCVVSLPTKAWAEKVFPGKENCVELLDKAILYTMRLDLQDPISAWEKHVNNLNSRAKFLTNSNFKYLHFKSQNGTDLKVGLAKNHVWLSAEEKAKDGISFIANMPTEEVFTAPDRNFVEGVVKSAKPLSFNGQLIDNFSITFKKGKVVSFTAEKGFLALKNLIETDKGTSRLGEVALIDSSSPIGRSGIMFFNTLFDENASCHLALGKCYPTTILGGESLSKKELKELGANDSIEHVDFMIGSPDICVSGYTENGKEVKLIVNGDWVI